MEEEDPPYEEPMPITPVHLQPSQNVAEGSVYASAQELNGEAWRLAGPRTNPIYEWQEKLLAAEEADGQDPKAETEAIPLETRVPVEDHHGCSLYFRDGQRSVDFVLVWDQSNSEAIEAKAYEKRQIFEANLIKEGLELEHEPPMSNGLVFIKIHAPQTVLRCYAEILKLRMPMKEIPALSEVTTKTNSFLDNVASFGHTIMSRFYVDKKIFPPRGQRYTAVYSRDKEYLFDINSSTFFTPAIHSRVVQFILDRKRFSTEKNNDFAFGIERLIEDNVYNAAYPLHDGDLHKPGSLRYTLYQEWGAVSKSFQYQPLDYVKEYFGVKIALYFAWLGFYTNMLIVAALVGFLCFAYSWATLYTNLPSEDICNKQLNIKMCPLCDGICDYWSLDETCLHARVTYLFDNGTTVFFAVFMSFWAACFLEMWKRYSAEITHRWDLTGFDVQEEHPRPQYLARLAHVKRTHVNVVTNQVEPHVPFWSMRFPATMLSFSVVILLITMAIVAVLAVVLYRMSIMAALSVYGDSVITSYALLITTATAASINLCCIMVFNYIYTWVAERLTEVELLRTQTEFDDSLTLKIYLLQFVNYYASIFYIAFFKGKFIGSPRNYYRLLGYRQEECGPGGCLMELCIQLAIIMIGKQAMNTLLEMAFPLFYKWLNTIKIKTGLGSSSDSDRTTLQWMKDYKLVEFGSRGLFPEYLEMVLQYGFVTIFVAAFPLAPLFALINNILEMRLDAKKLLTFYRRPVPQRVRDIGVWYRILDSIGKLAVITNGFIIAFTSNFIPRIVYMFHVSEDHSLKGFLNHSLAIFNVSDFENRTAPRETMFPDVEVCRYPDYREPPWADRKYKKTTMFYTVLAARLAFVVVFENLVVFVMILVRWCIPDMPARLRDQIRREMYITNEIIIKQETARARRMCGSCPTPTQSPTSPDVMARGDATDVGSAPPNGPANGSANPCGCAYDGGADAGDGDGLGHDAVAGDSDDRWRKALDASMTGSELDLVMMVRREEEEELRARQNHILSRSRSPSEGV